ncbi:MAG: hypothetical protein ACW986_04455 [Promethearchaeota archaeon]|jgi:hypothetical protein
MSANFKENNNLKKFLSLNQKSIKFQAPLILKMYGALNKVNMRRENRYILCNFLDQYSDQMNLEGDVYVNNNHKTLNQLFLLAFNKAKEHELVEVLYEEYLTSIDAINNKQII